ncbi:MAG: hypothetical protein LBU92_03850 [Prevotellaceae bacterium]|jgi:hypothetical protein|nr:hypothetical protein [Prevotellaceae bacterium]
MTEGIKRCKAKLSAAAALLLFAALPVAAQDIDALSFKKGVKISGGMGLNNQFYTGNNASNRRPPYAMFLTGNLNVNLFGMPLPFSFAFSNTSKSYTQPFNNFQLAPKYKWAQAHFGTVSMSFSEYTLAGHSFDGVGLELTPDRWTISAAYGRFLKAIPYNDLAPNLDQMSYRRMGGALRVGYTGDTYAVETSIFGAKDDASSLRYIPQEAVLLPPQDNYAIGIKARKTFYKNFLVDVEYSFSVLGGAPTDSAEQSKNFLSKLLPSGTRQRSFDAISASVGYTAPVWGLLLGYKRVAPGYTTFGGYYVVEDLESFTLQPSLRLWQNKVQFSAHAGVEYNNLNGTRSSDDLRIVASPTLTVAITEKWMCNAAYSNFTSYTTTRPLVDPNFADALDTLNFYQVNQSINAGTSYAFGSEEKSQQLMANFAYQFANSESKSDTVVTQLSNFVNAMLTYSLSIKARQLSLSAGFSFNQNNAAGIKSTYIGPTLSANKMWLEGQISAGLSASYSQNFVPEQPSSPILNTALSAGYSPKTQSSKVKHRIQANVGLLNRLKGDEVQPAFHELTATVAYNFNF